jgi:hypothetical protein
MELKMRRPLDESPSPVSIYKTKSEDTNNINKFEYLSLFRRWNWEWMVSLTSPNASNVFIREIADRHRIRWTRWLCIAEHIQVAYVFVITAIPTFYHFHLLMLGRNKEGKTLLDVDTAKWEAAWPFPQAKIKPVTSVSGAASYLIGNLMNFKYPYRDWDLYNKKLLMKIKK